MFQRVLVWGRKARARLRLLTWGVRVIPIERSAHFDAVRNVVRGGCTLRGSYAGVGFGVYCEARDRQTGLWHVTRTWLSVFITPHWYWGADHFWYDGPNCFFSLGFVHLSRNGAWKTGDCAKCAADLQ